MSGWVGVELRHLAALAAVAEERSFRGAADRLGYVQSAVSQRIAQLEAAVGVRLVERARGHKDVDLTEAGRSLLRHAERIDAQLSAARVELDALAEDRRSANLRIGASAGAAARLVPAALRELSHRPQQPRVELFESPSDRDLFEPVETGELDLALAELPLEGGPFESRIILADSLVALVPSEAPLARRAPFLSLADFAGHPFVVDSNWRMLDLVEAEFAASGLEIDASFTTATVTATQALVAAGLGVAIAPRLDVDPGYPGIEIVDLAGLLPSRTLVCFWSKERSADDLSAALDAIRRASVDYRWPPVEVGQPQSAKSQHPREGIAASCSVAEADRN